MMKFMEAIFTQEGPGLVVAREKEGDGVLVALEAREAPSPSAAADKKPVMKRVPGANRLMRRCPVHGVWFERECELCDGTTGTQRADEYIGHGVVLDG
jgi:hypothetical protein